MSRSWNKVGQYSLNNYDKNWVIYRYMVVNLHIRVIHNGDCTKVSCQSLYSFTVAGEGQEAMNCQIHALSLLLFAIVCNDDIAEEKKT